jgi:precorrin-2/cobalt-factor-2 C20-methyltransferase
MTGKLYVIGVGPGDPELLTMKAVHVLNRITLLCVPKGSESGTSLALSVVSSVLNLAETRIIEAHFPMRKTRQDNNKHDLQKLWDETVAILTEHLQQGADVAFITLGDPALYSTYFYLHDEIRRRMPELIIEIIPGITSVSAAAALANMPLGLGDEKIAILPATYGGNLKTILAEFDTVVLMKVHSVFGTILPVLRELNLESNCVYVSRVGMPDERIIYDISTVTENDLTYFSLLIVRRRSLYART